MVLRRRVPLEQLHAVLDLLPIRYLLQPYAAQ